MGNRKLDKIVVLDLEATCWNDPKEQGIQPSEIIEIGACFLDVKTGERSNKTSYIVRPKQSTVSAFCSSLTTLTQADVDKGIPFINAINKFKHDFGLASRVWGSWGDYDRKMLISECSKHGIDYPLKQTHLNIKTLHALKNKLSKELGLGAAITNLAWVFDGTQHRGADDAWNIAAVLWELIK